MNEWTYSRFNLHTTRKVYLRLKTKMIEQNKNESKVKQTYQKTTEKLKGQV